MNPVQTRRLTQEVEDIYRGLFYLAAWMVVGHATLRVGRHPLAGDGEPGHR